MQLKKLVGCLAVAFASGVQAVEMLPEVVVTGKREVPLPLATGAAVTAATRVQTSDTAKLLDGQPGVSLAVGGGVSSLPVIHGMADDRVRVKIDGMDLISACGNHMNPPLSYIDPANVSRVQVFAGIAPVSMGGDSIAGTILVDSAQPEFAKEGQGKLVKGQLGAFYRSNGAAFGGNVSGTVASETVSVRFTGSTVQSGNYVAGADFKAGKLSPGTATFPGVTVAGNEVAATKYKAENAALNVAFRADNHLIDLKLGVQNIPYQGFPNQYMDMLQNTSQQVNLNYTGQYGWGKLQARLYNEHTWHYMNFLPEKQSSALGMPMNTNGQNSGLLVKAELPWSERDILRVGAEYQRYRLNDWWSPVSAAAGMMSPNNFLNINGGQRDRTALFSEWDARWNAQWASQLGLRLESVSMNTGNVQGYNNMGGMMGYGNPVVPTTIPGAFNTANRQRNDSNIDLTAVARYTPDERHSMEFGLAQKTRSPNLYERYVWSSNNSMAMSMNNWVGDGNGYVGNLNLKPEVARTLSGTFSWHDADVQNFELKVAPYYTYVQNYIDAVTCASVGVTCPAPNAGFLSLSLANQTARLYGADVSLRTMLSEGAGYGKLALNGVLNYTNGKNLTTGDNLYHIMPLNAKLALEQRTGNWINTAEVRLVSAKTNVQAVRGELRTGGYGLLNWRTSYQWGDVRLDAGIENLLNKFYFDPLGGAYLGQRPVVAGYGVAGMGRSLNVGLTLKF